MSYFMWNSKSEIPKISRQLKISLLAFYYGVLGI